MIAAAWITALTALAGLILGFAWHGGQLTQILRQLRDITRDHEDRIRDLEHPHAARHAAERR